ncbi:hypothetical protein EVG20_g4368 [Dentipellis fragilis]|uniref:MYND-type domain-containing protein n=1 Tax=Dentipellis fragilis TaxID=205917 RepID=A0A4Y9YY89_9AGAM|nr:hypothetical protein EVG20_g4368 [Dentipellis fragilis]
MTDNYSTNSIATPAPTNDAQVVIMRTLSSLIEPCCSYCYRQPGKQQLRRCARCKVVRYCSKQCQRQSWESHKDACLQALELSHELADDPIASHVNAELNRWVTTWKSTLLFHALMGLDLPHNPPDYISTHFVFLLLVQRPNPPTRRQFFSLGYAGVTNFDRFTAYMRDSLHASPAKVADWVRTFLATPKDTVRVVVAFLPTVIQMPEVANETRYIYSPYAVTEVAQRLTSMVPFTPDECMASLKYRIDCGEPLRDC